MQTSETRAARSKRLLERLSHHMAFSQKLGMAFDACCSECGTVETSALQDSNSMVASVLASAGCVSPLVLDEPASHALGDDEKAAFAHVREKLSARRDGRVGRREFAGALASHAIARIRSDEAMSELKAAFREVLALRGHQLSITAAERELAAAADQSRLCEVSVVTILEATHDEQSVLSRKFGAFLAEIDKVSEPTRHLFEAQHCSRSERRPRAVVKAWTHRLNGLDVATISSPPSRMSGDGTSARRVGEDEFIRITRTAVHKAARDVFDTLDEVCCACARSSRSRARQTYTPVNCTQPEKIDVDDDDAASTRDSDAEETVGCDGEHAVIFDGSAGSRRARRWTTHVQKMRRASAKRRASSSPTVGDDDTAERAIVWAHETAIDDAAVPASSSGTGGVAAPATPTPTKSVETTPDIALLTTMLVDGAGARNGHLDHAQLEQARLGIRLDRMLFPGVWLSYTRYLPLSRTRSWSDFTGIWSINSTCPILVAVLGMANAMPHPPLRRARPTAAHAPTLTLARAWRTPSLTLTHQPAKLRRRSRQCSRASSWRPSARTHGFASRSTTRVGASVSARPLVRRQHQASTTT